jgi:hypothetical protein
MDVLIYNELKPGKLKPQFDKIITALKNSDFRAADVKKMINTGYYRAKLDDTNRLLFQIGEYNGKKYVMVLELILNHDYQNSRFLRGYGHIDESKFEKVISEITENNQDVFPVSYINHSKKQFNILDKVISFDQTQSDIEKMPLPMIIIGSAGSGKTALTLEKMKNLKGKILYVTLSPYLVENAKNLYYSYGYDNKNQEIDFYSFTDLLNSVEVVHGKEITFNAFEQWIWRYKESHKIKDTHKVFEEFKGVITGTSLENEYLSESEYLNLGVKQSIFSDAERPSIYALFLKYVQFLDESEYYEPNIISFKHLKKVTPKYDYLVVDEVQDITSIQLKFIIAQLHQNINFMLCGDSNQIVHPNFFSWSKVKTLFYFDDIKGEIIRILSTNYRNTPQVTQIANQLLLIKNARFGSIDKESTYLVESNSKHKGEILFYENLPKIKSDFNKKTKSSTKFAVIVLRNEDKAKAKQFFNTPLLFSIHEAKGLEYENVVLYDMISSNDKEYREIAYGIKPEDITSDSLKFARSKDKSDKSLDVYKFYINALYVAFTRAVKNLYVIESNKKHDLLKLLNLIDFQQQVNVKEHSSSAEDWAKEARKLELQGKLEQAESIRNEILKVKNVPWDVVDRKSLPKLVESALDPILFNKKAKDSLFNYALYNNDEGLMNQLAELKYKPAQEWRVKGTELMRRKNIEFINDNVKMLSQKTNMYGLDFRNEANLTPIMLAVQFKSFKILEHLITNDAKIDLTDNNGRNLFQNILLKLFFEKSQSSDLINNFYDKVKDVSLKLMINNQMIKLEYYQGEFMLLSYMIAIFRPNVIQKHNSINGQYWDGPPTFQTKDFLKLYENVNDSVVPPYRKARTYISSLLAKNEVNREDKYNKKLFVRLRQGEYMPNPTMSLWIDNEWVNFCNLNDLDNLYNKLCQDITIKTYLEQLMYYKKELEKDPNTQVSEQDFFKQLIKNKNI